MKSYFSKILRTENARTNAPIIGVIRIVYPEFPVKASYVGVRWVKPPVVRRQPLAWDEMHRSFVRARWRDPGTWFRDPYVLLCCGLFVIAVAGVVVGGLCGWEMP